MKVVIDIEANGLVSPDKIWLIVCKDIDTGLFSIFRNLTEDQEQADAFRAYSKDIRLLIGHNIIAYDCPVISRLMGIDVPIGNILDTYILSKLVDYPRVGHSVESYGIEFGVPKGDNNDPLFFKRWSQELEDYCVRDVEICHRIYNKYHRVISDIHWAPSIHLEQAFQLVVNRIHDNGFSFNSNKAKLLLAHVEKELAVLDKEILDAFPPRPKIIREITPQLTAYGTLHRKDFRWVQSGDLSEYNGGPFCRFSYEPFNPASHRQVIDVLRTARWSPVDKTKAHIIAEREKNRKKTPIPDKLLTHGWKVNENNLDTLPREAPQGARLLAKRILLESRRRTLTEWLGLVEDDGRIRGHFSGLGTWTHRTATQKPNLQNIPNAIKISDGSVTLLGKELRSLWCSPKKRLLVGVDAEAIQLRIFAHYVDSPELTQAIVSGKKSDKTDPHSLNQKVFGPCCKTRNAAKHSLYAIFFGGSPRKISEIMACSVEEAKEAIERLKIKYPGLARMEEEIFPNDARRGWFYGLDGRKVKIPGETVGDRKHLCMSGYLQNGEAVVMKKATVLFEPQLKNYLALLLNLIHDEWQTETPNDMEIALRVAKLQAASLTAVGEELALKCPLAGSYYNDDIKDYTIGVNWYQTH